MAIQMQAHDIYAIVIHCTATTPSQKAGYEQVHQWHVVENKWENVGYHLGIERDGELWMGRDIDLKRGLIEMGAHAYPKNRNTIGIVLEGGCSRIYKNDEGRTVYEMADNFTAIQKTVLAETVKSLIERLQNECGAGDIAVIGHYDINPTKECPGFDVESWWQQVSQHE